MKKNVKIQIMEGMEARPIAVFVQTANRFVSKIYVESEGKRVNAKSIMGMMGLALPNGSEATLDAEGADEEEAIAALESFLSAKD